MTCPCARLSKTSEMTYTPRKRDRYRRAAVTVTAATTVGALTATGWLAGVAAADYAKQQAKRADDQASAAAKVQRQQARYDAALARRAVADGPLIVYKDRPVKKRVTVQYVASPSIGSSAVGSGGTISTSTSQTASSPTSSGSGGTGTPAPPPPPPPPPPTPSSGS